MGILRGQRVGGDVHKDELLSCCTVEERVSSVTDQSRKPGRTSLSGEMRCKQKKKKKERKGKEQAQLRREVGDFRRRRRRSKRVMP